MTNKDRKDKPTGVLDHTQNDMVSSRGPVTSEPHEGHGGTWFEGVDAKAGMIITSLAIIGGTLIVVFIMTVGIQRLLERANPPGVLPSAVAPARVVPPEHRPVVEVTLHSPLGYDGGELATPLAPLGSAYRSR